MYDPRRLDPEATAAGLVRALEGEGPVRSHVTGSLAVAWTQGEPPAADPLCVVDGVVYAGLSTPPGGTINAAVGAAYRRQGEALFERLRGDFAIVAYDATTDRGVIVRDQMGGRGLCWQQQGDRLTFASEVRWLLPLLSSRPGPDTVAMAHWIGLSGIPATRTLHEGVHRLDAAHLLRFGGGRPASPHRYWAPRYTEPTRASRQEHVEAVRAKLTDAVSRRTRPDEPLAVLLSGGLDSSTVAAIASGLDDDRRPRRAYSATFPDHPTIDEGHLIDLVCDRLGLTSTRVVVRSGSVVDGAAEYINNWHVPPPSPNLFFWFPLLRRAAADGMVGFLDGEGGDEVFGLSPYLMADRMRRGRVRAAFDLARQIPGGGDHLRFEHLWPFVKKFGVKGATPPSLHALVRRRRASTAYLPPYLGAAARRAFVESDVAAGWKRLPGPRWWAYLVSVVTQGAGVPIAFDHMRRRAALAGLEARHPLVDVDLIEHVLTIPPELAFDTRYSRPLQRAVTEGLLPDEVRARPTKSTFDALFHDALAGPDLATARQVLQPGVAEVGAYVDLDVVASRLLAEPPPQGERLQWAMELWRLLTAECWLRAQAGDLREPGRWPAGVRPVLDIRGGC
jgi:asparagine synthase (glutamine-hydrolysing)